MTRPDRTRDISTPPGSGHGMRKALNTSFIAQFATYQEMLPKFDSVYVKLFRQKKRGKWHFGDAPLNFTVFYLKFNLVLDRTCKQTESRHSFCFNDKLWPLLYFFEPFYRSYLTEKRKKDNKKGRLSVSWLVHDQHRVQISYPNT